MEFIGLVIWFIMMVFTVKIARDNNRSVIVWGLVGLVFSPVISVICLWLLGKNYG